ncbi:MAG: hypothetical protein DMD50_09785 [Gemmatimonadetes bacterium]|nr:MAG: hypothetical protein DMD50_09785 [Gemmatimonadota bacterium]
MCGARRPVGVALLGCIAATAPLLGQQTPAPLVRFLRHSIGLDSAQLAAVERGAALVKVLDTKNQRDVAVFGIITADIPRQRYVAHLRDFPSSLRAPTRPRFGVFSDPATAADVQGLVVDQQDVAEVKDCHPDDCKIKLPATDMKRLREDIDWSAADPQVQVNTYARQRMLEYVTDYRARGDTAMVVYDDRGNVRASSAFAALLAESPYVYEYVPAFQEYLATYPRGKLDGLSEVLFWSEDRLPRLKPILSVTHLAIYAPPDLPEATFVAGKQIYADHYFEAGFDLTTVIDRQTTGATPGIYLVLLRRSRFDDLPTGLFNIRGKVIGKLRDQMRTDLERAKTTAEALGK